MSYLHQPYNHGYANASSTKRQPSTTSSSSSAYSNSSSTGVYELSRTSTLSSNGSSGYQYAGHKRGISETAGMTPTAPSKSARSPRGSLQSSPDSAYKAVRQSLRPLPQAPGTTPPPKESSAKANGPEHNYAIQPPTYSNHRLPDQAARPRPQSMMITRADSINRGSSASIGGHTQSYSASPTPVSTSDLESLQKSSTGHLRTLSKFAQNASAEDYGIFSPKSEVTGLHGRRRLQRAGASRDSRTPALTSSSTNGYGWEGRNWMDKQRQFLQAYEYLCHIGEAKEWIEDIIHKPIPPIVQLEEALRDGVTLAEIVQSLRPERPIRIFRHPKLQYRHSDNIAAFFRFLGEIELPDLFRFELIDLYEKKNIPKVIYCIHALSWLLFRQGIVDFRIGNLVGQLEFDHHELEAVQQGLDKAGVSMPSFGNMGADFGIEPTPEPEPVETEDERIDRELKDSVSSILELQAQIRGSLVRMRLGDTMQSLWSSEQWLVELQSRLRGEWARQVFDYKLGMKKFAVNLQSAARGFLVRQSKTHREEYWKSKQGDILRIQNLFRGEKVRDEVRFIQNSLRQESSPIRELQAMSRALLTRRKVQTQIKESSKQSGPLKNLQAVMRSLLLRKRIQDDLSALQDENDSISRLQAAIRAVQVKDQMSCQNKALKGFTGLWTALQAIARSRIVRDHFKATKGELHSHSQEVSVLQAFARAAAVRRNVATVLSSLDEQTPSVLLAQSIIRGILERSRIAADYQALSGESTGIVKLQGASRGMLFRQKNNALLGQLHSNTAEVTQLQALTRAMLSRDIIGEQLSELEDQEDSIVAIQAFARGSLVRARYVEKKRFFKQNMEKVVKIQSFVRGKLQGEAYKSLTTGKNPPVNTVKNFVHLLNDSDFDFNEEIEFERLRKTVVQSVRQNEMAEQYIDQLDIKIALLVKNKITLDEVVRHQRNFGGHTGSLLTSTSMSSSNQFDLKALNKNSRKKLESYQQLFFTLQTQPQYLGRLFKRIREQGTAERDCKRIETLMMGLFGYAQKRREEYYLLKLLSRSIKEEIDSTSSVQDYLRGNYFWTKLFSGYTRSPRDRKYLRELLGPLIRDHIIEDPALDLESDPMQIYRSAINNEELRTGDPSRRPRDVPRDVAIKDRETREMFIDHLRDLREISDQLLTVLEDLLNKMPFGVRFISRQMFQSLCEHFPNEQQHTLLQIVGNWLWRSYLQPALTSPEQVGVIEKQLTPLQKRNLGEVSKVLGQIAQGRLFGGENIYLQPLNAYVGESIQRISYIFNSIISVPDAEDTFDIDEFNDLYSKSKPTLYIKMADIFAIHKLIAADLSFICPNRDDMLRELVQELGSATNNESEMLGVTSTEIQLTLNPKLHDIEDPEADIKALFMETKRCVLYIIRVQSGPNLIEILVRPITHEDNEKWDALLQEEFAEGSKTRGAYSDANTLMDITAMSYSGLKRTALENIMRLERAGRISKQNYYQDILNAIALDIRTKSRRRVQRQRELEGVRLTLGNLHEKAEWLEQQRKAFDNYIEQAMMTLQNKKGKKKFLLPFTKQYNHERELQRSGRIPKFGSFKYSARALADKGVLVSWQGYSERQYDKINLTISCDEVGVYFIEGSMGSIQIPGASAQVPMDDLLQAQFNNHQFMNLFEGGLRLNVNLFLHLLYKKFYRSE